MTPLQLKGLFLYCKEPSIENGTTTYTNENIIENIVEISRTESTLRITVYSFQGEVTKLVKYSLHVKGGYFFPVVLLHVALHRVTLRSKLYLQGKLKRVII